MMMVQGAVMQWGLMIVLHLTADVWVMEDLQWFYASLYMYGWWRTYNGFMPHCRCMGCTMVLRLTCNAGFYFFVGGLVSSPAMSPSRTAVWDLLCFPPAYLLPDMMWLRLFGDTLNSVQASLAVPLFMYFHHNCNHRAATSSLVGLFLGSCTILAESEWGSNFFSNFCLTSSAMEAGLGSCTRLKYLSQTCWSGPVASLLPWGPGRMSGGPWSYPVQRCWLPPCLHQP